MSPETTFIASPVGQFIMVLVLAGSMTVIRYIKRKKPETTHVANLIEWFVKILIPVQFGIAAIYASPISPLWIYLVFVIGGALFVGIGVRNAYHNKDGWSPWYAGLFGLFTSVIFGLGVFFSFFVWNASHSSLFP